MRPRLRKIIMRWPAIVASISLSLAAVSFAPYASANPNDLVVDRFEGKDGCRLAGVFVARSELGLPSKTAVYYLPMDVRIARNQRTQRPSAQAYRFTVPGRGGAGLEKVFLQVELTLVSSEAKLACLRATYPEAELKVLPVTEVRIDFAPDIPGATRTSRGNSTPFSLSDLRKWVGVEYTAANIRSVVRQFATSPANGLSGTVKWYAAPRSIGDQGKWLQTPLLLTEREARELWLLVASML